jgi:serine/threonine-protein kinase 24/25/MST4
LSTEGTHECKLKQTRRASHKLTLQRATARELLQHKFIRGARRTFHLVELVNRYQSWKSKQKPSKNNSPSKTLSRQAGNYDASTVVGNGTMRSEWNFDDTIRGTIAGMPIELDLGALDDEEEEWDLENEEVEVWEGTNRIRQGSVIGGDLNTLNVSLPTCWVES